MANLLFDFETEQLPPAVVLATVMLIVVFALGIPYRVLVGLF